MPRLQAQILIYRLQGTFTQTGGNLTVADTLAVKDENQVTGSGAFTQKGGVSNINNIKNWGTVTFENTANDPGFSATIGTMTNYGAVKVTSATITFTELTNHGSYTSDPATTIILGNLTVGAVGYLVGGSGDTWQIGGSFFNASTMKNDWQTGQSILMFNDPISTMHTLQIAGQDLRASLSGY